MNVNCSLCITGSARWLVIDDKKHTYWEFYLTRSLKADLRKRVQENAYLCCDTCRRQIERFNATSKWPRRLQFLRWS